MLYNRRAASEAVTCIAGIYPVCDLSSYPRLEKASPAYGMTVDELRRELYKYNPVELLEPLAAAECPFGISTATRRTVPLEPNSLELIALPQPRRLGELPWPRDRATTFGTGSSSRKISRALYCSTWTARLNPLLTFRYAARRPSQPQLLKVRGVMNRSLRSSSIQRSQM